MSLGEKYFTGVVWQDFQHKQLMDLFFKIKQEKADGSGVEAIKYSLAFLAMYVNHHFKLEEEYMDIYYFPDTALHKKEHREFIKRIKYLRTNFQDADDEAVDKLLRTINSWILDHILKNDKKLGDYILSCEQKTK